MAVTTMRMSDLIPKNADKTLMASSVKPTQGLLLVPFTVTETRVAERSLGLGVGSQGPDSRSASPTRTIAVAHGSSAFLDELAPELDGTEQETAGPSNALGAPILKLEACPSFAEQSHKPLWLERHYTLQRAYSDTLRAKAGEQDDEADCLNRVEEDDGSDSGADCEQQVEAKAPVSNSVGVKKYLPGWEIARSGVWRMVESALLHAEQQQQQAAQSAHTDSSVPLATVAEDIELEATNLSASGPSASGLPSPFHSVSAAAAAAASTTAALRSACTTASPPPLHHMSTALNRARSISRSFLSTPLGLGAALVPSGNSLSSARSVCSFLASKKSGTGDPSKAAAAAAAAEQQQPHTDSDGRHHVAFAAGLAAATSAAAAVSHAAAVAVSGVAAATSASTAASLALELGGKALQAGGGILVDKVQNIAARHATAAVTELVMGTSSCEVQRGHLVNRVQATVAGASILFFLFNLASMSDSLAHLDFEHDFATSAKVVLDLVTSGPGLLENCKDLMQIGMMVGLGVANRNGFESFES